MARIRLVAAEFVTSAASAADLPHTPLPELAFAGRSNVGKSSVINALAGRTLARTSAAPGKTRLANYYRLEPDRAPAFHLVDLPGYGYARGAREGRAFVSLAQDYFFGGPKGVRFRAEVAGVVLLVDATAPGPGRRSRGGPVVRRAGLRGAARGDQGGQVVAVRARPRGRGAPARVRDRRADDVGAHRRRHRGLVGYGLHNRWNSGSNSNRRRRPARPGVAQSDERDGPHRHRQATGSPRRDGHAQAGPDLPDPAGPQRAGRPDVLRGRARDAAGRVRVPPRAGLQLPARP